MVKKIPLGKKIPIQATVYIYIYKIKSPIGIPIGLEKNKVISKIKLN